MSSSAEVPQDPVRRAFERSAARRAEDVGIAREIGAELIDRLAPVRIEPERVVDLGCASGHLTHELARMYRGADVVGVDLAVAGLRRFPGRRLFGPRARPVAADMYRLPLADASVDLAVANLAFLWQVDLPELFRELRRVLRTDGAVMFSSLGPDTLGELRAAWAAVDGNEHLPPFPDMHDIGDAMLAAGLRDPVVDVDRFDQGYADMPALLGSLRVAGAANVSHRRGRGLAGRNLMARLAAAYPRRTGDDRLLASWEVVYGHAWGAPVARAGQGDAREFRVSADSIPRRRARVSQ